MKIKFHTTLFIGLLFIAWGFQANAQSWEPLSYEEMGKILQGINDRYKNLHSFSVTVTHSSYENYFSKNPADRSTGYFRKEGLNYHSFLLGIHSVQNSRYKVVIDTAQNSIMVSNPSGEMTGSLTLGEYDALLKLCSSLKTYSDGDEKHFRMEFRDYTFSAIELALTADGLMKEMVFYYRQEVDKNPDEPNSPKTKPRLSIVFSDYRQGITFNYNDEFDEARYFALSGNRLVVTDAFKKFKLRDLRVPLN